MNMRLSGQARSARLVTAAALVLVTILLLTGFVTTKTTYQIFDGEETYQVVTYTDSLEEALTRAGITLDPLDKVKTERQGTFTNVHISRARRVSISIDGVTQNTISYEDTVQQLLEQQSIVLGRDDLVNPYLNTAIVDGLAIQITRRTLFTEQVSYAIPFETERVANAELEYGVELVAQAGQDGMGVSSTQVITYGDGIETRHSLGNTITLAPVIEVIEYGTKAPLHSLSVTANAIIAIEAREAGGVLTLSDGSTVNYASVINANATAYYAGSCDKLPSHPAYGITATGTQARVGAIAVDPKMIPYGTQMYIVTSDGSIIYGFATAEDCGGSIKGNRVDLYYDTARECFSFGRRSVDIYILE